MRAEVRLRLPDGSTVALGPGDLIGRVATAALVLDDPRVSEAHALVSLRGGALYLLSLRRLVGVRGKPVSEVRLARGLELELAEGLTLVVEEVTTPAHVLAVAAEGIGVRPLGQVTSILPGPPPRVVGRFVPGAAAHLWSTGEDRFRLRLGEGRPRAIGPGDRFTVGALAVTVCTTDLSAAGHAPTLRGGGIEAPLRLIVHYDAVELHRADQPVVTFAGIGARLLTELVGFGGPVGWETIARELWREELDTGELRHRWDVALGRLRARLREAGVRADLLRSDGGQLHLVLYDGDQVIDRS